MTDLKRSYAHDTHGALMSGYIRRLREHVNAALDEAAGWSRPYYPHTASVRSRLGLALGELLNAARVQGLTEDDVQDLVKRELTTGTFGCPSAQRDRDVRRLMARPTPRERENPSGDASWADYDVYVDSIKSADELRSLLKTEARMRRAAQIEAGG